MGSQENRRQMMKIDAMTTAENEAKRFLDRCEKLKQFISDNPTKVGVDGGRPEIRWTRESAAVERASLDLSNALVNLRRS